MKQISDLSYDPSVSKGYRLGHHIIDLVVHNIITMLVGGLVGGLIAVIADPYFLYENDTLVTLLNYGISFCVYWLYFTSTEAAFGATLGKLILGNTVINENGQKISFKQAALRSIYRVVPFEAFSFLGSDLRGWHDKWSNTYVISKKELGTLQSRLDDNHIDLESFGEKNDLNFEHQEHSIPDKNQQNDQ